MFRYRERIGRCYHDIAGIEHGFLRAVAILHVEASLTFKKGHAKILIAAANDKFGTEIGDPGIARTDDERMGFVVDDLKVCLAFIEPDGALVARPFYAQGGACIELNSRAITQSKSFAATNSGNV